MRGREADSVSPYDLACLRMLAAGYGSPQWGQRMVSKSR